MQSFRTEIPNVDFPFNIDYSSKAFFMGSCFSDNISQKLIDGGFSAIANPFGVLYNPISIKNSLKILLEKRQMEASDLIEHEGLFHSFSHHSSFSKTSAEASLLAMNESIKHSEEALKNSGLLFITFGTAFVYKHIQNQNIVSNCHKLPAKTFEHFQLSIDDIVREYQTLIPALRRLNPKLKIIFTVSPIRHWKDGAHENQLSKAILHLSIKALQEQFEDLYYYPSYELVMDDLRDYRFYAEDMIHLTDQAVDYIYQHFQDSFYSSVTQNIEKRVLKLKQALNHRPFNPDTEAHQTFIKKTQAKIAHLKQEYPEINLS